MFLAEVRIGLKKGVADPEGMNTGKALSLLGFDEVKQVKSIKVFQMRVDADDEAQAESRVNQMCKRLLVNPVIHTYEIMIKKES
jgi:phosphoribosylformylglycinamidine synthase